MRVEFRLAQAGVEYDLATSIVNVIWALPAETAPLPRGSQLVNNPSSDLTKLTHTLASARLRTSGNGSYGPLRSHGSNASILRATGVKISAFLL